MGLALRFRCESCDYEGAAEMGGGFSDFHVYEPYPIWCGSCDAVRSGNLKVHPLTCGTCGSGSVTSYMDPELRQGEGRVLGTHGKLQITDAHYLCPKCESYSANFKVTAFLD
jgi:Zn finger protein HypA/HybF involved in hydrogenase expression